MAILSNFEGGLRWFDYFPTCCALENSSGRLSDDKDVAVAAVTNDGLLLRRASVRLRDDTAVVLAAATISVDALEYASVRLRRDKDVVLAAPTQFGCSRRHASDQISDGKDAIRPYVGAAPLRLFCQPKMLFRLDFEDR